MPHAADFDPYMAYEARKPFRFNGVDFAPQDPFPVLDVRRSAQLYGRGMIQVRKGGAARAPVINSPVPEGRGEPAEPVSVTDSGASPGEPAAYEILEATPGWYDVVDADGNAVNQKRLRRPDAEEMVKELAADGDDPTA